MMLRGDFVIWQFQVMLQCTDIKSPRNKICTSVLKKISWFEAYFNIHQLNLGTLIIWIN